MSASDTLKRKRSRSPPHLGRVVSAGAGDTDEPVVFCDGQGVPTRTGAAVFPVPSPVSLPCSFFLEGNSQNKSSYLWRRVCTLQMLTPPTTARLFVNAVDVTDLVHSLGEPAFDGALPEPDVRARLAKLHHEWPELPGSDAQVKGLTLLYVKDCLADESQETRVVRFRDALGISDCPANAERWSRLRHLVESPHDVVMASAEGAGWQTFEEFCAIPEMASWNAEAAVVFFKVPPGTGSPLVQRHQKCGSCFEQAPVVMARYVFWRNSAGAADHAQVDLTALMLRCRTAAELWAFVDADAGGSSLQSLPYLTGLSGDDVVTIQKRKLTPDRLVKYYDRYGPGLISGLRVADDLTLPVRHDRHQAELYPVTKGLHAMVLVGYRRDAGQLLFLVQNWWKESQFLEVTSEYLQLRSASVSFITSSDAKRWPKLFPQTSGVCIESVVSGRETFGEPERVCCVQGPRDALSLKGCCPSPTMSCRSEWA